MQTTRQTLRLLRTSTYVLMGKDSPVIAFYHLRWHMLTLGYVCNPKMNALIGIRAVNFMSPARARKTVSEWLPYAQLVPIDQVAKRFKEELQAKVLATAEEYFSYLRLGLVSIAAGFTTDTLCAPEYQAEREKEWVGLLQNMMDKGEMGPFLHFEWTYDAMLAKLKEHER